MKRTTNKLASRHVEDCIPFQASNLKGVSMRGFYVVLSYNWYPIYAKDLSSGQWYSNKDKFSPSTSRQQSQARPYIPFGMELKQLTLDEFRKLLDEPFNVPFLARFNHGYR